MAWTTLDFTAFQTLTATQMDQLYANAAGLKDGTLLDDGAVKPQHLVTGTGSSWSLQSWTPTWTNLTIGNATVDCKRLQVGKFVFFYINVTLGSTSSVSSNPTFSLPITSISYVNASQPFGQAEYSNGSFYPGHITYSSTTTAILRRWDANNDNGSVTSSLPFVWGTGHTITGHGWYIAA